MVLKPCTVPEHELIGIRGLRSAKCEVTGPKVYIQSMSSLWMRSSFTVGQRGQSTQMYSRRGSKNLKKLSYNPRIPTAPSMADGQNMNFHLGMVEYRRRPSQHPSCKNCSAGLNTLFSNLSELDKLTCRSNKRRTKDRLCFAHQPAAILWHRSQGCSVHEELPEVTRFFVS